MEILYAIGGVAVVLLIVAISMYNSLVQHRNHVEEAWSGVETELQRRYDLIPNLVRTVQGYATHEKELLEEVTRMRNEAQANHGSPSSQAQTENVFQRSLGKLLARVEAYPDLKASKNFLDLQDELTNTEDRIQAARRFYNGNVRENNNKVQMVPTNLIASAFNFQTAEYFEIEDPPARKAPKVGV